ncbi:MAG: hypothetical protein K6C97_10105 [Treponema sp.]|nr:hypothetical protein [Treponema sp.]
MCWKCKKEFEMDSVYRTSECPFCHADLHACKGCQHYEAGAHYDCKEPSVDLVSDKEKSNFCDAFQVSKKIDASSSSSSDASSKARDAFNALFG